MKSELKKVTPDGREHGLVNEVANSVAFDDFAKFKEKDRENMRKQKKEDARLVKAQYLNKKGKGEMLERPYCRYAGDTIQSWKFIHGETYEVPIGLVNEVNNPLYRPRKRAGLLNPKTGIALETDEYEEPMHRFVPVGF
jgi:hypothetical protein